MQLSQLELGDVGVVTALPMDRNLCDRLCSLGLNRACRVTVMRKGWKLSPMMLRVGGTVLAVRQSEAQCIGVEKLI